MSIRPQQQVPESSACTGLSQHAEGHQFQDITFHGACNLRLLNSFLLRRHGLVNSWSHRLVSCHILHSSCKLPPVNSLPSSCQNLLSICLSSLNSFFNRCHRQLNSGRQSQCLGPDAREWSRLNNL